MTEGSMDGMLRQLQQQHPDIPPYVLKQMWINHVKPGMKQAINPYMVGQTPTLNYMPPDPQAGTINYEAPQQAVMNNSPAGKQEFPRKLNSPLTMPDKNLPSQILNSKGSVGDIDWRHVNWMPRPAVIPVSPANFDDYTLDKFKQWRFGFSPKDNRVRNDSARFQTQANLASQRGDGTNEPVILVRGHDNNKYRAMEGYHRLMSHLVAAHNNNEGAPPDQIELLKGGAPATQLDLAKWKPVPVQAYVGVHQGDPEAQSPASLPFRPLGAASFNMPNPSAAA
jgi:hypothetical protein